MKKLLFLAFIILSYFPLIAQEYQYDPVFFENSLMKKSYHQSEASYQSPSYVQHMNHRLPVEDSLFFTPGNALVLHHVSNKDNGKRFLIFLNGGEKILSNRQRHYTSACM